VRRCLVLALVAACSSSAPRPKPTAPPAKPASACLADDLGLLHLELQQPACGDDGAACAQACTDGDRVACWTRAQQIERDPATAGEAVALFRRSCELGAANGCTNYAASVWVHAPDPAQYTCALRLFTASCDVADHFACGMQGRLLIDRHTGDDLAVGRKLLERECHDLHGFPCRILALELERGVLGPVPAGRIPQLMRSACDGGDTAACGEHPTVDETFTTKP
jgi:hypothetical protein